MAVKRKNQKKGTVVRKQTVRQHRQNRNRLAGRHGGRLAPGKSSQHHQVHSPPESSDAGSDEDVSLEEEEGIDEEMLEEEGNHDTTTEMEEKHVEKEEEEDVRREEDISVEADREEHEQEDEDNNSTVLNRQIPGTLYITEEFGANSERRHRSAITDYSEEDMGKDPTPQVKTMPLGVKAVMKGIVKQKLFPKVKMIDNYNILDVDGKIANLFFAEMGLATKPDSFKEEWWTKEKKLLVYKELGMKRNNVTITVKGKFMGKQHWFRCIQ